MENETVNVTVKPSDFSTRYIITAPKPTWTWDVFGGGLVVVTLNEKSRNPSWRQRVLTRFLLGSTWTRLGEKPEAVGR